MSGETGSGLIDGADGKERQSVGDWASYVGPQVYPFTASSKNGLVIPAASSSPRIGIDCTSSQRGFY